MYKKLQFMLMMLGCILAISLVLGAKESDGREDPPGEEFTIEEPEIKAKLTLANECLILTARFKGTKLGHAGATEGFVDPETEDETTMMWVRFGKEVLSEAWDDIQTDHDTWTDIVVIGVSKLEKTDINDDDTADILTANLIFKYLVPVPVPVP